MQELDESGVADHRREGAAGTGAPTAWAVYSCPLGALLAVARNGRLASLSFFDSRHEAALAARRLMDAAEDRSAEPLPALEAQLREYFAGRRRGFDLPLEPAGTDFQRAVWRVLREVPWGETRSYAELAEAAGRPGAARAVGGAMNANPIAIVLPCHRVVGAGGDLTGYGAGLERKRWLLELERTLDEPT